MTRVRILSAALGGAVLLFGALTSSPAVAQDNDNYVVDALNCAQPRDGDGERQTRFRVGDPIVVTGEAGCFEPGAVVTVTIESEPFVLARVNAHEDGSYRAPREGSARVPDMPGAHTVRASVPEDAQPNCDTPRRTCVASIFIEGAPPTRLPVTGMSIALFAAWALMLVVGGSVLIAATWRRFREARMQAVATRTFGSTPDTFDEEIILEPFRPITEWVDEGDEPEESVDEPTERPLVLSEELPELSDEQPETSEELPELSEELPELSEELPELDLEPEPEHAFVLERLETEGPTDPEEVVADATRRSSDVIARLQQEVDAWRTR